MDNENALCAWDRAVAAWRADPYRVGDWQNHVKASSAGVDAVLFLATTFDPFYANGRYAANASHFVSSPAGVACGL
jgi:hypothetical protein